MYIIDKYTFIQYIKIYRMHIIIYIFIFMQTFISRNIKQCFH